MISAHDMSTALLNTLSLFQENEPYSHHFSTYL